MVLFTLTHPLVALATTPGEPSACGSSAEATYLSYAVDSLQQGWYLNLEGPEVQARMRYWLNRSNPVQTTAEWLLAGCGEPCHELRAIRVDDVRTDIRVDNPTSFPRLLDTPVSLTPGERTLVEVAAELRVALQHADEAGELQIGTVSAAAHRDLRVVVPDTADLAPARDVIASLQPLRASARPGISPSQHIGWIATGRPGALQSVALTLVEVVTPPNADDLAFEREAAPGSIRHLDQLRSLESMLVSRPPPGSDPDAIAAQLTQVRRDIADEALRPAPGPCPP